MNNTSEWSTEKGKGVLFNGRGTVIVIIKFLCHGLKLFNLLILLALHVVFEHWGFQKTHSQQHRD